MWSKGGCEECGVRCGVREGVMSVEAREGVRREVPAKQEGVQEVGVVRSRRKCELLCIEFSGEGRGPYLTSEATSMRDQLREVEHTHTLCLVFLVTLVTL